MSLQQLIQDNPTLTDDQILALVDHTTISAIPLASISSYLRTIGLERKISKAISDPDKPQSYRDGLDDFMAQLADVRQSNLDTTDPDIALRAQSILLAMTQLEGLTQDQYVKIISFGGGFRYPQDATVADVAEARRVQSITDTKSAGLAEVDANHLRRIAAWDEWHRAVLADPTVQPPTADQLDAAGRGP